MYSKLWFGNSLSYRCAKTLRNSVAKDRDWFSDYQPIKSTIYDGSGPASKELRVVGVGTVKLQTKRSPHLTGRKSHGLLVLHNVLHVPSAQCNVLGTPIAVNYKLTVDSSTMRGSIKDKEGKSVAYLKLDKFWRVKLSGPPLGPSVFEGGQAESAPSVTWSDEERKKWIANITQPEPEIGPEYTEDEIAVLEDLFASEAFFLRLCDLDITKILDRHKGRVIFRNLISADASPDETDSIGYEDEDIYNELLDEQAILADDWDDDMNEMLSQGLKPWDDDWDAAMAVLRSY